MFKKKKKNKNRKLQQETKNRKINRENRKANQNIVLKSEKSQTGQGPWDKTHRRELLEHARGRSIGFAVRLLFSLCSQLKKKMVQQFH
jgi:hypothetical protein